MNKEKKEIQDVAGDFEKNKPIPPKTFSFSKKSTN
jgi:hypothetical protein